MKALLDTHAFLWMATDPARIPVTVLRYLHEPSCTILWSVASVWEMVIKHAVGKLVLRTTIRQMVVEQQRHNAFELLSIDFEHVLAVGSLPPVHRDPFDRLLVAQALVENAVILTDDPLIRQYPAPTDW